MKKITRESTGGTSRPIDLESITVGEIARLYHHAKDLEHVLQRTREESNRLLDRVRELTARLENKEDAPKT